MRRHVAYAGASGYAVNDGGIRVRGKRMLNILKACIAVVYPSQTLATLGPADPRYWHIIVEAKKLAYADLHKYNGDAEFNTNLIGLIKTKLLGPSLRRESLLEDRSDTDQPRRRLEAEQVSATQLWSRPRLRHYRTGLWVRPARPRGPLYAGSQ
jgi:gamma-glutamyltranspeptidase